MVKNIRCAVLGLGRLGYVHAKNIVTQIQGVELTSVIDPIPGLAEQVARELGVEKWSRDPYEALEDSNIDAAIIVSPTETHAEMIKLASKKHKHIFAEKPLTQTLAEADEVVEIIKENDVYCQVGFMRRFDPAYVEAKKEFNRVISVNRYILRGFIGTRIRHQLNLSN